MATESTLGKVHIFPSEESYNTNKGSVGTDDLALVPIRTATTSEYGLTKLADDADLLLESKDKPMTVDNAYKLNDFRRMNKAYKVGDKVACAFEYEFYLECIQAGTTSTASLNTQNVTFGQEIEDGTVKWKVKSHVRSVNNIEADENGNINLDVTIKGLVLDMFFPVGSIYMSVLADTAFNPNTAFGGTWEKIENRFLYGAGNKAIGATGGAENVTLNIAQMPSHTHNPGDMNNWGRFTNNGNTTFAAAEGVFTFDNDKGSVRSSEGNANDGGHFTINTNRYWTGNTGLQGGGQAHENMPPYLVVTIWQRTA